MSDNLMHYGVKGMKWGVRREQITDRLTTLTPAEKKVVIAVAGSGATVAAALLAGPVGATVVSGITRAADAAFTTKVTTTSTVTDGLGNTYKDKDVSYR